ncbi:MAG TPA: HIT domain-containing protein, partial [Pirellulales bacterium]
MAKTIFKRIIDGEIAAKIIYQDDRCLAFHDVAPQAPTHVLVIPKREIASWNDLRPEDADLIGHIGLVIQRLAAELQLGQGYRIVV